MVGKNRVVITGLGVLAANGIGKEAFWNSLLAGESGIGPITQFDTSDIPWKIAGEIDGFSPTDYIDPKLRPNRQSRNTQIAAAATLMALSDANISSSFLKTVSPVHLNLGISLGGLDLLEQHTRRIIKKGMEKALPSASNCIHVITTSFISAMLDIPADLNVLSNSCTGGLDAIAMGAAAIQQGKVDLAIVGGTDAVIIPSVISGLGSAGMLATESLSPHSISRPFDLKRSGGVAAEGAGVLVVESLEQAMERGAYIYAEILGSGSGNSVITGVEDGLISSMNSALSNAQCQANDIKYINAHGPSDPALDVAETNAIKRVFGNHAYHIPISSIKGATGNPLAAGGALQAIACALSYRSGLIPPTTNYEIPDPDCDLDYVAAIARKQDITYSLINSHGTGGLNSSLVLKNTAI